MSLIHFNFQSHYLNCNTDIAIILPDRPLSVPPKEFYNNKKKYKVLWLLHGTYGDYTDWIRKSNIELYASEKDLIVVMPSVMNSNYASWEKFGLGYNAYDYLFDELMPIVYGWFPASDRREDNFVAGLSMGGRGTCVYAFNHPEKFAGAAILSAAPRETSWTLQNGAENIKQRTINSIENQGGLEQYQNSYENTWDILDRLVKEHANLPRLYFASGLQDDLYPLYQHFKEHAEEIGLDAVFEEFDGYKHEWRFWDLTIQKALEFFGL